MQPRKVIFAPEARDELKALYRDIADAAGPEIAFSYLGRLEDTAVDYPMPRCVGIVGMMCGRGCE